MKWQANCNYYGIIKMEVINLSKLLKDNKLLMKEYDFEKNSNIDINKITGGSNKKAWWKCKKGHEWQAVISNRYGLGRGCPFCSGQKRLKGYNDIFTLHPNWKKYWDYDHNELDPYSLGDKSHVKVNWICSSCGKIFSRILSTTTDTILCGECINKNTLLKKNYALINKKGSLLENHPKIAKEWNYEKNKELTPNNVTSYSPRKVWWICSRGHEWEATINSRAGNKTGCPYCNGRYAITGENDLYTTSPELLKEWNYEKNNKLKILPNEILPNSQKKVWWICAKGHEWEASLNNRSRGRGCPVCSSEIQTSYPEQAILFYLNKKLEVKNRFLLEKTEIDIFVPKLNFGIEYDGIYYHNSKKSEEKENKKNLFLKNKGVFLVRVKESEKNYYDKDSKIIYYKPKNNYENLKEVINTICDILNEKYKLNLKIDIDLNRDSNLILSFFKTVKKSNSLAICNKELLKEWNYEKNINLDPEYFDVGSGYKVWWKCNQGHEWQAAIYSRLKSGCPYCAGKVIIKGENDLATTCPKLLKEWNYEKNNKLNIIPDEVMPGSSKKVWWICPNGHEYYSEIRSRAIYGYGCKYCAGHATIKGVNDLASDNPKLINEWNYEKNTLSPSEYSAHSKEKVWWKCSQGHEWQASISNRNHKKYPTNCPYCAKLKRSKK